MRPELFFAAILATTSSLGGTTAHLEAPPVPKLTITASPTLMRGFEGKMTVATEHTTDDNPKERLPNIEKKVITERPSRILTIGKTARGKSVWILRDQTEVDA